MFIVKDMLMYLLSKKGKDTIDALLKQEKEFNIIVNTVIL